MAELEARTAKSVFHFDVQGSVAKSTHAGIPWLRYIRQQARGVARGCRHSMGPISGSTHYTGSRVAQLRFSA